MKQTIIPSPQTQQEAQASEKSMLWLPWALLIISWIGFIVYIATKTNE